MKVTLISGSPKKKGSASETLLSIIESYLTVVEKTRDKEVQINKLQLWQPQVDKQQIKELLESKSIVFAFPLYIDSIPSNLLRCLMQIEEYIRDQRIHSSLLSKINIGDCETLKPLNIQVSFP